MRSNRRGQGDNDLVKDVVVPVVARKLDGSRRWRPIGTGFFLGANGHIVTCAHVAASVGPGEELAVYQDGQMRWLRIEVIHEDAIADLALCFAEDRPGTTVNPPLLDVYPSYDVFAIGYQIEERGPDRLPIAQRVAKGYVVAEASKADHPDSYELSFPSLTGMSGAPVWCHVEVEGPRRRRKAITGVLIGTMESRIDVYKRQEVEEGGIVEREVVSRVVEHGIARKATRLVKLFDDVKESPEELRITVVDRPGSQAARPLKK